MHVWSRGVKWDAANYHGKPYGSTQEIPVPENLNYEAWMGPSEMVPYAKTVLPFFVWTGSGGVIALAAAKPTVCSGVNQREGSAYLSRR